MSDLVMMDMDDATYLNLTETQIRESAWFKHSTAMYEQLYGEDKAGILLVHRPSDKHHEHDQRWILDDGKDYCDDTMEMGAFQACLFEEGTEVPGRYHGVVGTAQTRILGFEAIYELCHTWYRPWTSSRARFKFNEILRQCADLYPAFRTPQYYSHVLKVSNVVYHPFALFSKPGEAGIAKIPIIWQTPWLRQNVSRLSMEAWLVDGIWPFLNCGTEVQLTLHMYFLKSKEFMTSLSATKRPRAMIHTGGLHRLTLRACNLGLVKDHPISSLTIKREKKGAAAEEEKNSYKGTNNSALDTDTRASLAHRENSVFSFNDSSETLSTSLQVHYPHPSKNSYKGTNYSALDTDTRASLAHRENSVFNSNDSSETFVDSSERYWSFQPTADNFGTGKYNDMPLEAARELLEKRDNMIASTQSEVAAVNLKLTELQSTLDEVNRQSAETIPRLERELKISKSDYVVSDISLKEALDKIDNLDQKLAGTDISLDSYRKQIADMKRVADELNQTTNYQLNHLMAENKRLQERDGVLNIFLSKTQQEYKTLEQSCDGWEDQMKRVETQRDTACSDLAALQTKLEAGGWEDQVKNVQTERDSALKDLKLLQQKMDKDTTSIEKGVSATEAKYNTLKKHYKDLQTSCDKDLANFQSELKSIQNPAYSGGVVLGQHLEKIADLEKRLQETNIRLMECCNGCKGPPVVCSGKCGQQSSSLDNSKPGSSLAKSALDMSNTTDTVDYETDYCLDGHSKLLTISEATKQLGICLEKMDTTISDLRADGTLTREQKSEKYFDTCNQEIQLTHNIMADWAQKTISFPVPKSMMRLKGSKKQKCACCGKEEGGWDALHNRADPTTGLRVCPHKGINCTNCKKYGLLTLDTNENYINHTAEACPLNNLSFFTERLSAHLLEKHGPDLRAASQLSAFDQ